MERGKLKTYTVSFLEINQFDPQTMTIQTRDIKWTVEQIGRNREIDGEIQYKEVRSAVE